jgi:hypothetical protein
VLGALSKSLATICTQPLIVAKVGLQSNPPPERNGKPFKSFTEVMRHIVKNEGLMRLFKGIGPQITKGLLVQGFLMMAKERQVTKFLCAQFDHKLISHFTESNSSSFFSSATFAFSASNNLLKLLLQLEDRLSPKPLPQF